MEGADLRALIEREVRRQLGLLEPAKTGPSLLVVWACSGGEQPEGQAQLVALQRKGYVVRQYAPVPGAGFQTQGSENGHSFLGADGHDPIALLASCDVVVVPGIGWMEAARLALGLADAPGLQVVFAALVAGLPVVIASEGCLPAITVKGSSQQKARRQAIVQLFEGYVQRLRSFGARLVPVSSLATAVEAALAPASVASPARAAGPKQIVTGEDVLRALEASQAIVVPEGSIVTALAADLAKAKGVAIEFTR